MDKTTINELIAEKIMGFERGDFGCVEGNKLKWICPKGYKYMEYDHTFPDYWADMRFAIDVAEKFDSYKVKNLKSKEKSFEGELNGETFYSTRANLSEAICQAALLAWGIEY